MKRGERREESNSLKESYSEGFTFQSTLEHECRGAGLQRWEANRDGYGGVRKGPEKPHPERKWESQKGREPGDSP